MTLVEPLLPTPADLPLAEKFVSWRPHQEGAVLRALDSDKRFVAQGMATGSGKSLVYMAHALLNGGRAVVLTSTKALEDQLTLDFSKSGLFDIRGRANYPCRQLQPGGEFYNPQSKTWARNCEYGPCRWGRNCQYKQGGCQYYDTVAEAQKVELLVTNYSYWMAINGYGGGLGKFDLLILDEAHHADRELCGFLEIILKHQDLEDFCRRDPGYEDPEKWKQWARDALPPVVEQQDRVKRGFEVGEYKAKEVKRITDFVSRLAKVAALKGKWVVEGLGQHWSFNPVWGASYAERVLFLGVPRVVLYSATIRPKTCEVLGIDPEELDFAEYPHTFPERNRLLVHVPTVRMNHHITAEGMRAWLSRIDQILDGRGDRKGIIHTVSYKRRDYVLENSRHRERMVSHTSRTTAEVVARFKRMPPPAVLVSPSVTTGFDFPGDECRFQIIGKIPFPDTRSAVMKARVEEDDHYSGYVAMQELVQMTGRGVRSQSDWCESLVIDDMAGWFLKKNRDYAPGWFRSSFRRRRTIPPAPRLTQ